MELYNTTLPHKSLIHEIWTLCDADITSYPLKDVIRRVNSSMETLIAMIINADGTWQFDDTNYTDTPVGTGLLVEGQESYSFASRYLDIEFIEILDKDGTTYRKIKPLDPSEIPDGLSVDEYFSSTGFPEYYDKQGDTIKLYPAPTADIVTLTAGLKVHFKRTAKLYTMSDSTTITSGEESVSPGIATPYHELLAQMSALPFQKSYKKDRVIQTERDIEKGIESMIMFYSRREKDKRKIMRNKRKLFR